MSLITPTMPPAIIRAYTTGLGDFVNPNDPLWSVMLENFVALEQFNLDLDKLKEHSNGPLLSISNYSGWRFLAADGDLYGACHMGSIDKNLPPKVTGFSRDVQVLNVVESFNELNTMDKVKQNPFEPRVLRIAWLRFEAFWLKFSPPGGPPQGANAQADDPNDLVIPYIGFVERPRKTFGQNMHLERMTAYTVADFLSAVGSHQPSLTSKPPRPSDVLPPGGFRPRLSE
jgi:hypothetical protein